MTTDRGRTVTCHRRHMSFASIRAALSSQQMGGTYSATCLRVANAVNPMTSTGNCTSLGKGSNRVALPPVLQRTGQGNPPGSRLLAHNARALPTRFTLSAARPAVSAAASRPYPYVYGRWSSVWTGDPTPRRRAPCNRCSRALLASPSVATGCHATSPGLSRCGAFFFCVCDVSSHQN